MFYVDYASRRKSHAASHVSGTAPTSHYLANATVTAAGVLGILAFSLGPALATYPIFAVLLDYAALGHQNATHAYRYQKLEFDYVCGRSATSDTTITMRCTAETTSSSEQLSTLNCDVKSMSMPQLLQLQKDGKCVVGHAELTNETRIYPTMRVKPEEQDPRMFVLLSLIFGSFLLLILLLFIYMSIRTVKGFLFYRCIRTLSPPLSPQALRGHFLTPKWQKYLRCVIAISCSFFVFHVLFALLDPSAFGRLDSAWYFVTVLTPFCPLILNVVTSDATQFALSLPDSVFENGVTNHEQIERIRHEKREEERRRLKQVREDRIKEKYAADMEQLRKDFD